MTRQPRDDEPGAWHHVMNRGIARRTMFENDLDMRMFLARLARVARAGRIEVHAFCVLTTHFHLLVRSPRGELSAAMQAVQNEYVRWFNRARRRDGPLVRGRFSSKRVTSLVYRRQLVRYIDANAVAAGLVSAPSLYPHGSARHYARLAGPQWLSRSWIEESTRLASGRAVYSPSDYAAQFGSPLPPALVRLVERRTAHHDNPCDPLDDLLSASHPNVVAWMRRKAELADGTAIGFPVCDSDELCALLEAAERSQGTWSIAASHAPADAWLHVRVGLLRDLCGATLAETATRASLSVNGAWRACQRHRRWLIEDDAYAARAAQLARAALRTVPEQFFPASAATTETTP